MSRCARAGREHSQAASPGWPTEVFHTMGIIYEWGLAEGQNLLFLVSMGSNPLLSRSLNFSQELGFFWEFCEILKNLQVRGSATAARGLTVHRSSGGEKNCVVYRLFCIFISSSSSISFVALLNRLYLNPRVSAFVHFSFPSRCGEAEG